MSFHEKSATAMLVLTLLIYGNYFFSAFAGFDPAAGRDLIEQAPALIGAVVVFVVLTIVAQIVITVFARKDERDDANSQDERDKLISNCSRSHASTILAVGVVVSIGALILGNSSFLVAHMLLGALVLSDVVRHILILIYYRRGL